NVAVDHATNLLLLGFGFRLPAGALCDRRFSGLTAEQIYARLRAEGYKAGKQGFDQHIEPGDVEGSSERNRDYPSGDERRRLRATVLRDMARERQRRGQGLWPGELQREIDRATRSTVPWQTLLARFFSDIRRTDYRLFPFNKKHLWRGIYLPSAG